MSRRDGNTLSPGLSRRARETTRSGAATTLRADISIPSARTYWCGNHPKAGIPAPILPSSCLHPAFILASFWLRSGFVLPLETPEKQAKYSMFSMRQIFRPQLAPTRTTCVNSRRAGRLRGGRNLGRRAIAPFSQPMEIGTKVPPGVNGKQPPAGAARYGRRWWRRGALPASRRGPYADKCRRPQNICRTSRRTVRPRLRPACGA